MAIGLVASSVRSNDSDVLKSPDSNASRLRDNGQQSFIRSVGDVNSVHDIPEVDQVAVLRLNQLNNVALRASQRRGSDVRDGDVDLADGHVAVVVVGQVLNHRVLEDVHWRSKPAWADLGPSNRA